MARSSNASASLRGEEKLEGYAHRLCACSGSGQAAFRADSLFAEVDMLDEHDLAVIVFDDVVAAEPIAVLKAGGEKYGQLIDKLGSEFHATGLNQDDAYDLMNGVEKANTCLSNPLKACVRLGNDRCHDRIQGFRLLCPGE